MPFLRSLVETAMDVLRESGEGAAPSSVTTSVSSTRTPPWPGRYTPGSTVTTKPGARIAVPSCADRRGLVDVEAHAVAGAVLETVGPAGLGDDLAADVVHLLGGDAGAHRRRAGRLRGPHHLEDAGQLALGVGVRRRRSGSCPSGSPRRWRRSRPRPGRPAAMARPPGWWCGLAEFSPAATMVSKAVLSAPPRRMAVSSSSAKCSSVTPWLMQGQHLEERGVGDGGGPLHAGDLRRVLDLAQRLDRVARWAPGVGAHQVGPDPLAAQVTLSASSPTAGCGR